MLLLLPPDLLALIVATGAEPSAAGDGDPSLRVLACCCHSLRSELRFARPLLAFQAQRIEEAVAVEAAGTWRLRSLLLLGSEAELKKSGFLSETWDIFSIAANSQAGAMARQVPPSCAELALLAKCPRLACLAFDGWPLDADGLGCVASGVPLLDRLALRRLKLSSLAPCTFAPCLTDLEVTSCWRLFDLQPLAACARLTRLTLRGFKGTSLPACPSLVEVAVFHADALNDLWGLGVAMGLSQLTLHICHAVRDLSALTDCSSLSTLELDRCTGVRDVSPLSACARLRCLTISRCPCVVDLSPLTACANLELLSASECAGLTHFSTPRRVIQALARIQSVLPPSYDALLPFG